MSSLNKVQLIGHLGADAESRSTDGGTTITNFRLATTESWKDKQSGEKQERTEWHRIVIFGKLAEIIADYGKKGRLAYVEGSLRTNKYTDKDGIERYSTDVIADEVKLLGPNPENAGQQNHSGNGTGNGRNSRETSGSGRGQTNGQARQGQNDRNSSGNGNRRQPEPAHRGGNSRHDGGAFDDDIPY